MARIYRTGLKGNEKVLTLTYGRGFDWYDEGSIDTAIEALEEETKILRRRAMELGRESARYAEAQMNGIDLYMTEYEDIDYD